jgi:hypothetical protein
LFGSSQFWNSFRSLFGVALALLLQAAHVQAAEMARPADAVVDSMGINVHCAFGMYVTNWQAVIDAVHDIGFRTVRDIPYNTDRLNALTAGSGAKLDIITQYGWYDDCIDINNFDATWSQIKQLNNVGLLEMPNEPQGLSNWASRVNTWTATLYNTARADPVLKNTPIVATTVGDTGAIAEVNPYLDYGNIHSYPGGYLPTRGMDGNIALAQRLTGDKPIIATETGYNNAYLNSTNINAPGVSEAASAKYLPRVFLNYFNAGIIKTFSYELVDSYVDTTFENQEAHFGILRSDFTYKPAAVALKNLITLLKDPGEDFTPAALDYTITGGNADLGHTLLQKRDGTFWLALWQEVLSYDPSTRTDLVIPPLRLTLDSAIPFVKASTYLPNNSTDPTASAMAAHLLNINVDDQVLLVALQLARPGDANADGAVDNADLAIFFHNYGAPGAWEQGDFNGDGKIDFLDFQKLEVNYDSDFSPAQQAEIATTGIALPEPGIALPGAAILMALACSRRRRHALRMNSAA